MMPRFRPGEVLAFSLLGPVFLVGALLLFRTGSPGSDEGPQAPAELLASRTRTLTVFTGLLPGGAEVLVFAGLSPGVDGALAMSEGARRLGLPEGAHALTLLLCNPGPEASPALGGGWSLSQGANHRWEVIQKPAAAGPEGGPMAALFTPPGASIPPGGMARQLFQGGQSLDPAGGPLILSGPGAEVRLAPEARPAHQVLHPGAKKDRG